MADIKISEMTTAATLNGTEVSVLSQSQGGQLVSVKATLQAIANWFAVNAEYTSALNTTDKRICGAINELKQLISLIPQFSIEVVQTLPTEDISDTTIYLVPAEDPEVGNYYEEYIYVNNTWELVGTTAVDLSDYYTKAQADGKFAVTISNTISPTTTTKKVADIKQNNVTTPVYADDADAILRQAFGEHTASGNPVSVDAFLGLEVASECKVTMNPIQDLHGYDSPWVGGAGKNKLPFDIATIKALNTAGTWNGDNYTHNGVTYSLGSDGIISTSNTANGTSVLRLPFTYSETELILNGCPSGGGITVGYSVIAANSTGSSLGTDTGSGVTISASNVPNITQIQVIVRNGTSADNLQFKPMMRLSTVTDATFAPYSNICPISGRDSVTVTRTGKNLFGGTALRDGIEDALASTTITDTTISFSAGATVIQPFTENFKFEENTQYTFIFTGENSSASASNIRVAYTDGTTYDNLGNFGTSKKTNIYQTTAGKTVERISKRNSGGSTTIYFNESGIFKGLINEEDFEPYTAETHTHTYSSTVYGGVDDFVSGEGKSDTALLNFTSSDYWAYNAALKGFRKTFSISAQGFDIALMSNLAKVEPSSVVDANFHISYLKSGDNFYLDFLNTDTLGITTADSWKALLTSIGGASVAIKKTITTQITNTPEDISLLKGVNVVSTDADSLELKYSADIKAYIDSKLA